MKSVAATIVLCLAFACCIQAVPSSRIINGNPAAKAQFNYQAFVTVTNDRGAFICSGTIVGRKWIVTAGRCIAGAKNATIAVGSNTLNGTDSKRYLTQASRFVLHERYDANSYQYNIGLIQTTNYMYYISGGSIGSANLPEKSDAAVGDAVTVSGWGVTTGTSVTPSNDLMFVVLTVQSNQACSQVYGTKDVTDDIVCASGQASNVQGICAGDLGDPLVLNAATKPVLVGIGNFYSTKGCQSTDPSAFTRVYSYVSWIKKVADL